MACYLVTGGAGFIGSNIVDELLRRGETVRVLDNLSTGRLENLAATRERITFDEADIRAPEKIARCFEGVDYVIHEAALASVAASVVDPASTNAVNVDGTLNVLLAARDARVKRVVFAASSAAYGDNPRLPLRETEEAQPLSPYALTKLAGECYCKVFFQVYGLETVALRYFNVFGPRQDPSSPYSGVLSIFVTAYLRQSIPVIFGDGEQSRDFTYVENVVEATIAACRAAGAAGKVINIGTGQARTLNQIIAVLNGIFARQVTPRYESPRVGDVRHSLAEPSLARRLLAFETRVGFEEGLRRTVEWYRASLA
jgi:UDP-glucose 4-epimerase